MKVYALLVLTVFTLSAASCKLCKKNKDENTATVTTPAVDNLIVQKGFVSPTDNDPISINSISIEENILKLEVEYSGGCEKHEYKLYFDGNYKKSMPPKASFILVHDNKGDQCRSIVTETLTFDISPAQYTGQKEMMVSVEGLMNEVSYKY